MIALRRLARRLTPTRFSSESARRCCSGGQKRLGQRSAVFLLWLCLLCGVINLIPAAPPACALAPGDITIQINPTDQEFDLVPGTSASGRVKVKNIGRLEFNFHVFARPYQALNENYDPDFNTSNSYTKLQNWIEFPVTEFHLGPGEETFVDFVINVPLDVPAGGQYAAVIMETRDSMDGSSNFQAINQVASLIYGRVAGETHESGQLISHTIPKFLLGSPFAISARVENTGNIDFKFTQSITIWDFFTGREIMNPDAIDVDGRNIGRSSSIVLPGSTRYNALTWEGAPQLGVFRVHQTISLLGENHDFESLVFVCPIWLGLAVLFLIVLMIIWLILRAATRKKHRSPRLY